MNIILVDHYDSFSWNVCEMLHRISLGGVSMVKRYFDEPSLREELIEKKEQGGVLVVLSPGPCTPKEAHQSVELYRDFKESCAFWGICLGHQIMGWCEGFSLVAVKDPLHGSSRKVHWKSPVFGTEERMEVGVYNSLRLEDHPQRSPDFAVVAMDHEQEIAAIQRTTSGPPLLGVQFHPESYLSKNPPGFWEGFLESVWKYFEPSKTG